ncbi:MAG: hypothetical protein JST00_34770 [Deltaproteobacteria bacterium]|nr:hypothetical protein [Deltaproteobacteria bacterium]
MATSLEPVTAAFAAAHAAAGVLCLGWLRLSAAPILGAHPAWKPMRFGFSIASFLVAMALILPLVDLPGGARKALGWLLSLTMAIEMLVVAGQAMRGTTSHFNRQTSLDASAWSAMVLAIGIALLCMAAVALVATFRPLTLADGTAVDPLLAASIRLGLWPFVLVAFTGARMAALGRHTVVGPDGGVGLPVVDWSTSRGDLRVPHFFALHAIHVFPLAALALRSAPVAQGARWAVFFAVVAGWMVATVRLLVAAMSARPVG